MKKILISLLAFIVVLPVCSASIMANDTLITTCCLNKSGEFCGFPAAFDTLDDWKLYHRVKIVFDSIPGECMNIDLDLEETADNFVRIAHYNYNSDSEIYITPSLGDSTGRLYRIVSCSNSPFCVSIIGVRDSIPPADPTDPWDYPGYTLGARECMNTDFGVIESDVPYVLNYGDGMELEHIPRYLGDTVLVGLDSVDVPNTFSVNFPFDGWGDAGFTDDVYVTFNVMHRSWDDTVFVDVTCPLASNPGPHRITIVDAPYHDCHGYYANLGTVPDSPFTVTFDVPEGWIELDGIWISTAPPPYLAVELASFNAVGFEDRIEIAWVTVTEFANAGFNLYRSDDPAGDLTRLNPALIPAEGSEFGGAAYSFADYNVASGKTYCYWFEDVGLDGEGKLHGPVLASPRTDATPLVFGLAQNYPNPFNPTTEIRYNIPADCFVTLEVYNVVGARIATLVDEHQKAGSKIARWDGKNNKGIRVTSGVYFYKLQAGDFVEIKKMILMR